MSNNVQVEKGNTARLGLKREGRGESVISDRSRKGEYSPSGIETLASSIIPVRISTSKRGIQPVWD